MDNSYFYIRVRYRFNNYYGDKMKLSEMTLIELIYEAEKLQYGSGLSDYMTMYNEMLKRLKEVKENENRNK